MAPTALVTGASRGIGRATAAAFLGAGWRVLTISRSPCDVPGVVHTEVDLLAPAVPTAASDWAARVTSRVADVLGEPGVPSSRQRVCVVHNAALMEKDSALDPAPPDVLRRALELNVVVPQQLNALLLPSMGVGSSILYVGSTLSEKAVAGAASYATAKHAMLGLMRATCQDLAVTPGTCEAVHTAAVCPGFVDTPMLREHLGWAAAEEAEGSGDQAAAKLLRREVEGRVGFGRLISPEEVAAMLCWCADQPLINGATLHANLGQIER